MLSYNCWCFDFDGTLVDLRSRWEKVHRDLIREFGGNSVEDYINRRIDGASELDLILEAGVDKELIQSYNFKRELMLEDEHYLRYDRLFPKAKLLLKHIKDSGQPCWIITHRSNRNNLERELAFLDIKNYINGFICTREEIEVNEKNLGWSAEAQDTTVLAKAHVLMTFEEKKIVMVGDSPSDILAAKHANVESIGIPTGITSHKELNDLVPNFMFNTIEDLYYKLLKQTG
jgi:phosphoglycolate phosphatase-like HAD superfamily hydrolase